ncbi:predicted protein, partial [Nematostella vectensis]
MKKLYITLSFVIASGILSAQNNKTKSADKLFDRFEYVEAANEYLKLVDKNQNDNYINQQLADSYYNVFNTKEAVKWYAKLVEEEQKPEVYYKYAQMLKAEGNYEEANKQMQKFASLAPNDSRAMSYKSNPNYLSKLKSQRPLFDIKPSDISSDKSDFGGVLTNDNTIYFTSARNTARKSHGWNNEPYLDIYQATYNDNDSRQGFGGYDVFLADLTKGTEAINVGEPVNSEKDDFSFTFNTSKNVALFSSNREGVDNIYLANPICGVNAIVIVKSAETRKTIEGATINVIDPTNNIIATNTTNDVGQKIFEVACETEYSYKVSKDGYEDAIFTSPASGNGSTLVEAYLEPIKPIITEKEVILQPIYFEFNKSNITAQGAEELDKLVAVMNEYPEMIIFAKSHTDNR